MRKSDYGGWLVQRGSPGTVRLSKATYRSHLNREHERTISQLLLLLLLRLLLLSRARARLRALRMVAESEACGEIRTLGEQARREKERERERKTTAARHNRSGRFTVRN